MYEREAKRRISIGIAVGDDISSRVLHKFCASFENI